MLEYIYTLSDRIDVCDADLMDWKDHGKVSADMKHLTSVLVAADMFLLPELVKLAGEKIHSRISEMEQRFMLDVRLMPKSLFSGLVNALYSNRDCPALKSYQAQFAQALYQGKRNLWETLVTEKHLERYPNLGMAILRSNANLVQSKNEKIKILISELSIRKWKKFACMELDVI